MCDTGGQICLQCDGINIRTSIWRRGSQKTPLAEKPVGQPLVNRCSQKHHMSVSPEEDRVCVCFFGRWDRKISFEESVVLKVLSLIIQQKL